MFANLIYICINLLYKVEHHSICIGVKRIVHCFGVTRHPDTGRYMMVTNFANQGQF